MQKVLTAAQMREVDRLTTERYGIPSIILMENAAHAVERVITEKLGGSVKGKSVLILCGPGNNGGDGAALARILWNEGAYVTPLLFGRIGETKGDARVNFDSLRTIEDEVATSGDIFNKLLLHESNEDLMPLVERCLNAPETAVVVDAVFGTGLKRPLGNEFLDLIQRLDNHRPQLISIDIPSGLDADHCYAIGRNMSASTTVTFTSPKPANVLPPASNFSGELVVASIGSSQELIDEQPSQLYLAERKDAVNWLERTGYSSGDYKNKRGHALIIAGSANYSGAAVLAGNAAMRSGVGLVTVVTPKSCKDATASRILPEVMVRGVAETKNGAISEAAFDEIGDLLEKADSIAIGCGLSQDASTKQFVKKLVANRHQPVVVDADALNLLSPVSTENHPDAEASPLLRKEGSFLILTPHEGEFKRLLGETENHPDPTKGVGSPLLRKEGSYEADRVAAVREFATRYNVVLVLKGERVLIGAPDGRVVVNPTGNSGLGKAGNGDTLTGILVGFVAQAARMNVDIFETVVAAVYVAGMAGDIAETTYGKRVMTASDVRECLAEVFRELSRNQIGQAR